MWMPRGGVAKPVDDVSVPVLAMCVAPGVGDEVLGFATGDGPNTAPSLLAGSGVGVAWQ
jgi:hypothetical protein